MTGVWEDLEIGGPTLKKSRPFRTVAVYLLRALHAILVFCCCITNYYNLSSLRQY